MTKPGTQASRDGDYFCAYMKAVLLITTIYAALIATASVSVFM